MAAAAEGAASGAAFFRRFAAELRRAAADDEPARAAVREALAARGLGGADEDGARDRAEARVAAGLGPEPLTTRVLDAVRERLGASREEEILVRPSPGGLEGRRPRDLFLFGPEYGPADGAAVEISDSFTVAVDGGGYVAASNLETAGPEEEEDAREFVRTLARRDRIAADDEAPPNVARLYFEGKSHFVARESDGVRRVRRAWISGGER